jgi:hypothetical protein
VYKTSAYLPGSTWSAGRKLSHLAAEEGISTELAVWGKRVGFRNAMTVAGQHEGATFGLHIGRKPKYVVTFAKSEHERGGSIDEALAAKISGVETGGVEFEDDSEVPNSIVVDGHKWL